METVVRSDVVIPSRIFEPAVALVAINSMDKDCYSDVTSPARRNITATKKVDKISVALLTGGADKPYVCGLALALISKGVILDVIGSDELDRPEFHDRDTVNFLNLRGDQRPDAAFLKKILRVLTYYFKLIRYAATTKQKIFHILWNNKFESFDRTLLMMYYRLLRKSIVLTVHNVNAGKRDSTDTALNRLTLRIQYCFANRIFVHTEKMKRELITDYGVGLARVTVIPFGINNAVPQTLLTPLQAKQRLGLDNSAKAILFFGNLAPYKGLEYLIAAFRKIAVQSEKYRLILAGSPDIYGRYWLPIREGIREEVQNGRIILRDKFVPDEETEIYFKAADVLVLPYKHIYQSGVLFLGHSFGVPVIAADVGSLKDEIVEGQTGFVFTPKDPDHLARTIESYFASDLYANLDRRRSQIREYVSERHSWGIVAQRTIKVYAELAHISAARNLYNSEISADPLEEKSFSQRPNVTPHSAL